MQKPERYRQFADTLMAAAEDTHAAARDVLLKAAETWRALAETADREGGGHESVIDFAGAARRLRPQTA